MLRDFLILIGHVRREIAYFQPPPFEISLSDSEATTRMRMFMMKSEQNMVLSVLITIPNGEIHLTSVKISFYNSFSHEDCKQVAAL